MLRLPERGIRRSVTRHNSRFFVLCDWIEASAIVDDGELTRADVLDNLMSDQIYSDQGFCSDRLADVWNELRRRHGCLGAGPSIAIEGHKIRSNADWRDSPALCFCLHLSLAPFYAGYREKFGSDYSEQGELFELVGGEAVRALFGGWEVHRTGWSASNVVKLKTVVPGLANKIRQEVGNLEKYGSEQANESGLDLAWFRPFPDARGGYPVYLLQCASGENWSEKLHTPELLVWAKLIEFTHPPSKAFACPFSLMDDEFVRRTNQVGGLLLDRYRLLVPGMREIDWLPLELRARLVAWLEPRHAWMLEQF